MLEKLIAINKRGMPVAILILVVYIISVDLTMSVFFSYHSLISISLFMVMFLAWVYQIMMYELRTLGLKNITKEQKIIFTLSVFTSLLSLNAFYSGRKINFIYILLIISSFAFFMWILFFFINKFAIQRPEVKFYFGIILLASILNIPINYLLSR